MTEKELITKAKSGSENAFEEIINLYKQRVCSTIFYMIRNENIVEDIAQEVFIKVYKNISKFNEESSLYTWIYRITINACLDEMKKEKKITYLSDYKNNSDEIEIEDKTQNIDEIVEKSIEKSELIRAIKNLPADQRAIIVLRDIKGFSYWEISDMLKIKLGTVKSKISRARDNLKTELQALGYQVEYSEEKATKK